MNYKNNIYFLLFLGWVTTLFGCNEDVNLEEKGRIQFLAKVSESGSLITRDLSIKTVTSENFKTPFYIRKEVGNEVECGIYEIPSGYEGRLETKVSSTPLKWKDSESEHTFYGWTMPWKPDENYNKDTRSEISFDPEDYEGWNCEVFEQFIGVRQGPVNYRSNGEYVELQFYHLVSKIVLDQITLITAEGQTINDVRGSIQLIGMPLSGIFDRRPADGINPPVVLENEDGQKDVTFTFSNQQTSRIFYVFPGMDISSIAFRIDLTTPAETEGSFWGNFSSVNFKRPQDDEWHKDKSPVVLYAGEVMHMSISLSQGKVTGVSMSIDDWNTQQRGTGTTHSRNGIYSDKDLSEILGNNYSRDELKDIFGEEERERIVFHQYEDLDHSNSSLLIFKDGTLDGMGHTINMKSQNSNVYLKNVRDIYITDGTNTIYIDSEGYVHTINPETGKMQKTDNKMEPDTQYRVNLSTGVIRLIAD